DGNQSGDNQLGLLIATLGAKGLDVVRTSDGAIDCGELVQLVDLQTPDFTNTDTTAGFALYRGANPRPFPCVDSNDTVCRHHLQGTGTYYFVAPVVPSTTLAGLFTDGVYR